MAVATRHPPETKAAVIAALLTGQSVHSLARQRSIPESTIRRWKYEHTPKPDPLRPQKKEALGEQLFAYLQDSIETLGFLVRFARNDAWATKQNAADLAVFYGVVADKAVRLLGAFKPDDGPPEGRGELGAAVSAHLAPEAGPGPVP